MGGAAAAILLLQAAPAAGQGAANQGATAADADARLAELRGLTIEQLANLEITSVSRRPEAVSEAAASIDVITADDIRRSGAQSLPEVLRLARNLEVARVSAQHYAISARGFNTFQASNKLLVLIDGRSVYTPLYSGVLWDQQLVSLPDVERIEVVSGPGGTLWGANAVNGVINVITKSAVDTQGGLAQAQLGSVDQRLDLRYGGRLGPADGVSWRVFGNLFERGEMLTAAREDADDDWGAGQLGFRTDWGGVANSFSVQGAAHDRTDGDGELEGGHLLGRWRRLLESGSTVEAQAYYWSASARQGLVSDALETVDLELQHTLLVARTHQIVWGGGLRHNESEFVNGGGGGGLVEERRALRTASLFVQDEIALAENLAFTLGLKIEDHTFTGVEYMPNARLAWRPTGDMLLWAAISRAVRTPSRIDRELEAPGVITPSGEAFESEDLTAYELGWRMQPTRSSTVSATIYLHDYDKLRTLNFTPPGVLPVRYGNGLAGEVYGLEAWGDLALTETWDVSAGVTLLESDFDTEPLTVDFNGTGRDPDHQVFLRTSVDLAEDWELDVDLRNIAEISPSIPGYTELGARLGWRINDRAEIALTGRNLLHESHPESFDEGELLEARRSVDLSLRVTY
jgi:iron complex outermembrane receptor protein